VLPILHLSFVFFSHVAVAFRLRRIELSEVAVDWVTLGTTHTWARPVNEPLVIV
jgi:hypothetical protein